MRGGEGAWEMTFRDLGFAFGILGWRLNYDLRLGCLGRVVPPRVDKREDLGAGKFRVYGGLAREVCKQVRFW